jgi:CRISPR/Cas system-associated endoribonuclease Cas2
MSCPKAISNFKSQISNAPRERCLWNTSAASRSRTGRMKSSSAPKVDPAQLVTFKARLLDIIDPETDSLRFYHLGSNWHHKVEHHGANDGYDVEGTLVV